MDWLIGEELFLFHKAMIESANTYNLMKNDKINVAKDSEMPKRRGRPTKMTLDQFIYSYNREMMSFLSDDACLDWKAFCKKYKICRSLFFKYRKEMDQKT